MYTAYLRSLDLGNAPLLSVLGCLSFSAPCVLEFAFERNVNEKYDARANFEGAARERGAHSKLRVRNLIAAYSTAGVL